MTTDAMPRAEFHAMVDGTPEDWQRIMDASEEFRRALPSRVLAHLRLLGGDSGGFAVDRLEHSLQTATRAYRAGRDDEYVVCALLHDIGDVLCPMNHADVAAAILRPFVSDRNAWMLEHHTTFQGYNYFHFLGFDRNARDKYAGHEHYDYTVEFCQEYDQCAFDPSYDSMPLEAFVPAVEAVLAPKG